jgi:hypothetical protein
LELKQRRRKKDEEGKKKREGGGDGRAVKLRNAIAMNSKLI